MASAGSRTVTAGSELHRPRSTRYFVNQSAITAIPPGRKPRPLDPLLPGGDLGYPAGEEVTLGRVVGQLQGGPVGDRRLQREPPRPAAAQRAGHQRGALADRVEVPSRAVLLFEQQ